MDGKMEGMLWYTAPRVDPRVAVTVVHFHISSFVHVYIFCTIFRLDTFLTDEKHKTNGTCVHYVHTEFVLHKSGM